MASTSQVIVTGNKDDAPTFTTALKKAGVQVHFLPTIRIYRLALSARSLAALRRLSSNDYIFFTSAHGISFFVEALKVHLIQKPMPFPKIVAVGSATARACRALGLRVSFVPKEFTAESLVKTLPHIRGKKILWPRSAIASRSTDALMSSRGALLSTIPLYTALPVPVAKAALERLFKKEVSQIAFMSASSVASFSKSLEGSILRRKVLDTPAVCIGPSTARAARACGFKHVGIAPGSTTQSIIRTLSKKSV